MKFCRLHGKCINKFSENTSLFNPNYIIELCRDGIHVYDSSITFILVFCLQSLHVTPHLLTKFHIQPTPY
jgi:hypothetical protein